MSNLSLGKFVALCFTSLVALFFLVIGLITWTEYKSNVACIEKTGVKCARESREAAK